MMLLSKKQFTDTGATEWMAVKTGPMYPNKFAIQAKGVGAAAGSWSVDLEGSLDGVNPTTLITHSSTDGATKWPSDNIPRPVAYIRAKVNTLTLGSATALDVFILATA